MGNQGWSINSVCVCCGKDTIINSCFFSEILVLKTNNGKFRLAGNTWRRFSYTLLQPSRWKEREREKQSGALSRFEGLIWWCVLITRFKAYCTGNWNSFNVRASKQLNWSIQMFRIVWNKISFSDTVEPTRPKLSAVVLHADISNPALFCLLFHYVNPLSLFLPSSLQILPIIR